MESADYLAALERENAAFATASRRPRDAAVPATPAWTLGDLVYHLTVVQDFWKRIVAGRLASPDGLDPVPRAPDEGLAAAFESGAVELTAVLAAVDPDTPVWTWTRRRDAGWVMRRMALEAAVHRWDAESAGGGRPAPIEHELAADGIDEFATYFATPRDGALPVRIQADDATSATVLHGDVGGTPVGALCGSASDLLLVLWRRLPLDAVTVDGDPAAVAAQIAATELA